MKDNISSNLIQEELKDNNNKVNKRKKLSDLEKSIIKVNYLANLKIKNKYNGTKKIYEKYIINLLINNSNCHVVSIFKERMLTDYIDEFLRRIYIIQESKERIPKFAIYYKNYLLFFCQPTFTNFVMNELINDHGEKRAELYYKNNYQGGKSNDNEDLGFQESDSEDESNKNINYKINENGEIFDDSLKENIDNVTIMTTINNSKNNTINLNLNNEKIEVFSENKCDKSNDTTLYDLMDIVIKGQEAQENLIKEKNNQKKNFDNNSNIISNTENNNCENSNNNINNNKSKKRNKNKNELLNLIDYKKEMVNHGDAHSQNKKKEGSKSVKKHLDKKNIELYSKGNKIKNKISIDKFKKLFNKGKINIKNLNLNKNTYKFPINIFLNIINYKKRKHFQEKKIENSNLNLKRISEKETNKKKEYINKSKKLSNHSVNLNIKNKSTSKDKEQDKKNFKNKTNNNRFYSIKNSYGNINSNILQNIYNKTNNNYNIYIGGHKNNSRSRNNTGFLYKQQFNTNNIINNNIIYNLNNIYNTTSLHKLYKNFNNNTRNNGYLGKMNPFKTLNFIQAANYHPKNNNIQINKDNKYHISNTSQENKSSSLKILMTDFNNPNIVKPTIKLKNEKELIKSKYNNKDFNNIFEHNQNKNHRITKSFNNLNLNNIYLNNNNGIISYYNLKNKNKNNLKVNHQLKNIKRNQINSNSSNKTKNNDSNNKELMQFALSLLLDNNNSAVNNMLGNNNIINKKSNNSRNNKSKNSVKKSKTLNNNKNKYNNTNYNININNQININTNTNNLYNNFKNGRDYLNTKIKTKELNINNNLKDTKINNFLNTNSNLHISNCNGVNNNLNSENINLHKKIKGRNISGLKKRNIRLHNIQIKNEDNIIKSYHTKSVSSLSDLINNNKKIVGSYKNISKNKSKEYKNNC